MRFVLFLAVLALGSGVPGAGAVESYAPSLVAVGLAPDSDVVVSWAPGSELADAYSIYGISGNTATLLATFVVPPEASPMGLLSVLVPDEFTTYGVSGILENTESQMVFASVGGGRACIYIDPPNVGIQCIPIIGHVPP